MLMSDKATLFLTSLFITFAAIANLVRALWNIPITIGTLILPGWTGAIIFIGLGLLATWSFRALAGLSSLPPTNSSNL